MAGEKRFSRIPPESTGDRLTVKPFLHVSYTNRTQTIRVGDIITGSSSQFSGEVAFTFASDGTNGYIVVHPSETTREKNVVPSPAENLVIDAVTVAQVGSSGTSYDLYTPSHTVSSGTNPTYHQEVDRSGAAFVRFTDGPAEIDAFGKLRTSSETILGLHTFETGIRSEQDWQAFESGGASVTHDSDAVSVLLSCPSGSIGAFASHTSDLYHHYFPGQGQKVLMSLTNGDTGKTNVRRRWGIFDNQNGLYFELDGTDLFLVVRSNVSGSVVEQRFAQEDWNRDTVDGSFGPENPSGVSLDVSKINLYEIDYAWLGSGQVKFSIHIDGYVLHLHAYYHANNSPGPWMRTPSLPIRLEQENTGSSGSTSELRMSCAMVSTEIQMVLHENGDARAISNDPFGFSLLDSDVELPIMSVRNKTGRHHVLIPTEFHSVALDSDDAASKTVRVNLYRNASTTGGVWLDPYGVVGGFEANVNPTAVNLDSAELILSLIARGEMALTDLSQTFNYPLGALKGKADGTSREFVITAKKIGADNVRFRYAVNAVELKG